MSVYWKYMTEIHLFEISSENLIIFYLHETALKKTIKKISKEL